LEYSNTHLYINFRQLYFKTIKEVHQEVWREEVHKEVGKEVCKEVRGGAPGGGRRCAISCTTPRALSVLRQYHYVALELNMDFILSNKADCVAKLASD
jgi:hypothetical protein